VNRHVTINVNVPRPEDSVTQPINAVSVGDGLVSQSEQVVVFIAFLFSSSVERVYDSAPSWMRRETWNDTRGD
jgi:hypothetical protein